MAEIACFSCLPSFSAQWVRQPKNIRLPASRGDRKWFGDGRKRDNGESAGI
jgi:hypothetical protein